MTEAKFINLLKQIGIYETIFAVLGELRLSMKSDPSKLEKLTVGFALFLARSTATPRSTNLETPIDLLSIKVSELNKRYSKEMQQLEKAEKIFGTQRVQELSIMAKNQSIPVPSRLI